MSGCLEEDGLIDSCLLDGIDCALEARDDIGAIKAKVYITTRQWDGDCVGDGDFTDCDEQVYPTPHIVEFSHDINLKEGGTIKNGDIMLKGISLKRYTEEDLDLSVVNRDGDDDAYFEKFYKICGKLYEVVSITRKFATWNVMIRRLSVQPQYRKDENSGPVIIG